MTVMTRLDRVRVDIWRKPKGTREIATGLSYGRPEATTGQEDNVDNSCSDSLGGGGAIAQYTVGKKTEMKRRKPGKVLLKYTRLRDLLQNLDR